MEFIFELLVEFIFQLFGEALVDIVIKRLRSDVRVVVAVICIGAGAGVGALTLLVYPHHIIGHRLLRHVSAVCMPFVLAFVMTRLGSARIRKGQERYSLEYFATAWLFAFSLGAVRVLFAQ